MPERAAAQLDLLLDAYLDDLLADVPPDERLKEAAPDLAYAARQVVAIDHAPSADAAYVVNGWAALLRSHAGHSREPSRPAVLPPAAGGFTGHLAPPARAATPALAARYSWLAGAILVLFTALAGYVAFVASRPATMSPASLWTIEGLSGEFALDPISGNVWLVSGPGGFTILSPSGDQLEHWGVSGRDDGEFQLAPWGSDRPLGGAAFDREGNLYVADAGNSRIQKFGPDRTFITTWGSPGYGNGKFEVPEAIVVTDEGLVYVADQRVQSIQIFDRNGQFLGKLGAEGQFKAPAGLAADADGNIWVSDVMSNQVQKVSPDGKVLAVATPRDADHRLRHPAGLAVDRAGRLYVADFADNQIEVFDAAGTSLATWDGQDVSVFPFEGVNALATDNEGNLFVSDRESVRKVRIPPP